MISFRSIVFALTVSRGLASATTYTNPLKTVNGSDTFIVYTGEYYYLATTTWDNIQITRATTLNGLKTGENKVVWTDSTASRCCNVWAPEIHEISGVWYIYYTAGESTDLGYQRPYVLKGGSTPWDSYSYLVATINSQLYFIWSCFSGSLQSLCMATMSSPSVIGTAHVISTPTNSWETVGSPVNEGPQALVHNGNVFMSFSASYCWTASYSLGLLTLNSGASPLASGAWTKTGPVFGSANGNYGTGHNGFFVSPDGTQVWNSDGSPNFGTAPLLSTVLTGPSGE
ncbi:glycoside hydrolase family 43 protein [Glonium stellatum]|uniref:Glycoside hydrolase family 43 protein n=1 Tax=Glonium stellatum TaxID=574774 RepID=A0A8E2JQQ3_9PEZI|nr:glycoside hydrolase family 43 protein [Glonium stellatum]